MADLEKGEGRRWLWPSAQLVAQGLRLDPGWGGLRSGAPTVPTNTLTPEKPVTRPCTQGEQQLHELSLLPTPGDVTGQRSPLDQTQLCRQHLPWPRSTGRGGPSTCWGYHTTWPAHGGGLTAQAVPPLLSEVSLQHIHNTDRHGMDPTHAIRKEKQKTATVAKLL